MTEYLYLGPEKVNGQDTFHYRKVLTVTYAGTKPLSRRDIDDFWINSDGLMVKEASEGSFGTMDPLYKNVTNYEYPKDLKIVAPIPD